jgi:acetyl-CoA acyltransferase
LENMMRKAYIIDAKRTPVGKVRGLLSKTRGDDLLVHAIKSVLIASDASEEINKNIDDIIVGCAMPEGPQGLNIARIATLLAGLPDSTPAYTLNRFCSSGLQSVSNAADLVKSGSADLVIAAGVESMSSVPMTGFKPSMNPKILSDENISIAYGMGLTAEKVVQKYNISREAQDEFAFDSHQKAILANSNGSFVNEISPITTIENGYSIDSKEYTSNSKIVSQDEGPREDTSLEVLAKLRTVFAQDGSVTAGNSSQMSDGAAAVLVASEEAVEKYNLTPKAEFMGFSVAGVPAEIMGIGPIKAVPKVLKSVGLSLDDIGWIELNEAFAAQSLAVISELGLDAQKVNPLGGAIALGHPLGATGSIRIATLVSAMQRENIDYGMVTMCIGTGMGAAGIIKNIRN